MGKIIVTIDGNVPSKFAHSFNVMKMAQGFKEICGSVEVVTLFTFPILRNLQNLSSISHHYGVDKDLTVKFLPVFNMDFFTKTIGARSYNRKAAKYIKKSNPDFAYCRSYLTVTECLNLGIPVFVETHTTHYDHPDLKKVFSDADNHLLIGLVTISENLKEEYMKRGVPEEKILVLDDGVDIKQFDVADDRKYWRKKLGLPEDESIVLYSGGLYPEKGIRSILETQKLLQNGGIRTVLVGGTEQQIDHWKSYCRDSNIQNVFFKGFAPNSEIPQYLKAADVLIMPYDKDIEYKVMDINTTSPLKLFEYLAAGRPIVSSNIPVISQVVKHEETALLADIGNIQMLADNVHRCLNDRPLIKKLSENAAKLAKNFSWQKRAQKILSFYEKWKSDSIEKTSEAFYEVTEGDLCIDCGANVGNVTSLMAAKGAEVYSFEPNPFAFDVLKKRFKDNPRVHCINKGVWDRNDKISLYFHEKSNEDEVKWSTGSSILSCKKNISTNKSIDIDVIDLIEFIKNLDRKVAVLKIDVEGAEIEILEKIISEKLYLNIGSILVETHDHKIPELKAKTDHVRETILKKGIKNISLDWI